jgi:hypothetical protein
MINFQELARSLLLGLMTIALCVNEGQASASWGLQQKGITIDEETAKRMLSNQSLLPEYQSIQSLGITPRSTSI